MQTNSNFPDYKKDFVTLKDGRVLEVREIDITRATEFITSAAGIHSKTGAATFSAKTLFDNRLKAFALSIYIDNKQFGTLADWRIAPLGFVEEVRALVEPILGLDKAWAASKEIENEKND